MHKLIDFLGNTYFAPDDGAGSGDGDGDGDDDDKGKKPEDKTFTQAELNRIAKREKEAGKKAALEDVAKELGMSVAEAKKLVDAARSQQSANDDEADRKLRDAEERERKAEEREKEATRKEKQADARAELISEGVPRDQAARVAKMLDIDDWAEADDGDITDAISILKKEMPTLFEKSSDGEDDKEKGKGKDDKPKPPDSSTRGKPPAQKTESKADAAKQRLLKRHPRLAEKAS